MALPQSTGSHRGDKHFPNSSRGALTAEVTDGNQDFRVLCGTWTIKLPHTWHYTKSISRTRTPPNKLFLVLPPSLQKTFNPLVKCRRILQLKPSLSLSNSLSTSLAACFLFCFSPTLAFVPAFLFTFLFPFTFSSSLSLSNSLSSTSLSSFFLFCFLSTLAFLFGPPARRRVLWIQSR